MSKSIKLDSFGGFGGWVKKHELERKYRQSPDVVRCNMSVLCPDGIAWRDAWFSLRCLTSIINVVGQVLVEQEMTDKLCKLQQRIVEGETVPLSDLAHSTWLLQNWIIKQLAWRSPAEPRHIEDIKLKWHWRDLVDDTFAEFPNRAVRDAFKAINDARADLDFARAFVAEHRQP